MKVIDISWYESLDPLFIVQVNYFIVSIRLSQTDFQKWLRDEGFLERDVDFGYGQWECHNCVKIDFDDYSDFYSDEDIQYHFLQYLKSLSIKNQIDLLFQRGTLEETIEEYGD